MNEMATREREPMTRAQIQAAYRARKAQPGLKEVRGIWLPPHLHAKLKDYVKATKVFR